MIPLQTDLSIFNKLKLEQIPVGIKFQFFKPDGIKQLDKPLSICEMPREAQQRGEAFYMTAENESCFGKVALGMVDTPTFAEAGEFGPLLEIYEEARANFRIYEHVPMMRKGTVNYVIFSPLDKLTFDPDLLFIIANASQAEIILRAMSYSTGELWETKTTPVLGCAWFLVYPFLSGKVNFTMTGLAFGMKAKQVFPEGKMLISIPFTWIPAITRNLNTMKWVLPSYTDGREKFIEREERYLAELARRSEKP